MENYLDHEDSRVAAILHLARVAADYPALPLDGAVIVQGILPRITQRQAADGFNLIAGDLYEAADYDTRGSEAVEDHHGPLRMERAAADEWANELRDKARANAQLNAEMLASLNDKLAGG